jgi:triacylglycerol lipase
VPAPPCSASKHDIVGAEYACEGGRFHRAAMWARLPAGRRTNHRAQLHSLSTMVVENGHSGCSSRSANTMDTRSTTASLLSAAQRWRRPLLLVHGFLATPRVVGPLARRLSRRGYCPHSVELGGLFHRFNARPVEELAGVVAERVEQLVREHRCERIDLVGHSEGGLIGRYYVQKLGGACRVRHLVTLGTPHRGTPWAYSGHLVRHVLPSLRQMAPGSPLLRDLADDSFPASVRLTSIYSRRDSICRPVSCRLETRGAPHLQNVEVIGDGHLALLLSAEVPPIISRVLESAASPAAETRCLTLRRLLSSAQNDERLPAPFARATERAVA